MSKIKSEMATRCELALMGKYVPVRDNSEIIPMVQYMLSAMGVDETVPEDFLKHTIYKYGNDDHQVKFIGCNTLEGMRLITMCLETTKLPWDEEYYPAPFEETYGTKYPCSFCYVYNVDQDFFSQFGDCFFRKHSDGYYHRVS